MIQSAMRRCVPLLPAVLLLVASLTGCLRATIPVETEGLCRMDGAGFAVYGADDPAFLGRVLEASFHIYDDLDRFLPATELPGSGDVAEPRMIVVHRNAEEFRRLYRMIDGIDNVGGFCGPDGVVVLYRSTDEAETFRTLAHELVHLYLREHYPVFADSTVLAHGLAYYLGASDLVDGRIVPRSSGAQALRFSTMVRTGRVPETAALVALEDSDDPEVLATAWSIVAYLMEGDGGAHRADFVAFCRDVEHGDDPTEAFSRRVFSRPDDRGRWLAFAEGQRDAWIRASTGDPASDALRLASVRLDCLHDVARRLPVELVETRSTLVHLLALLDTDDERCAPFVHVARDLLLRLDLLLQSVGPVCASLYGMDIGDPEAPDKAHRTIREIHRIELERQAILDATHGLLVHALGLHQEAAAADWGGAPALPAAAP